MNTVSEHEEDQQPLIDNPDNELNANQSPDTHHHSTHVDDITSKQRSQSSSLSSSWLLLTFTAGLSGLLFGYDTGVISSTLISLDTSLSNHEATDWDKSLITSMTSLCALLSSPASGYFADTFGRKPVISFACALFVLGALVQAFSFRVATMVLGRGIVGVAVGTASGIVPVYVSEIAPAHLRGRLVTVQSLMITGGQVVAYLVGWAVKGHWRVAVGLGALPAVIQAVLLVAMCESPRWLVMTGRRDEAAVVLARLNGAGRKVTITASSRENEVEILLTKIDDQLAEERAAGVSRKGNDNRSGPHSALSHLLHVAVNRRALAIACMLQGFQQLAGFNTLCYFSATIFEQSGFSSPILTSLSVVTTNFLFTLVAFSLIDSLGRRRTLLVTIPFMIAGLVLISLCFRGGDVAGSSRNDRLPTTGRSSSSGGGSFSGGLLLASMMLYVASYATGLGCVPWQQAELFPLNVRSLGSGIATAMNWASNTLVGITFLPLLSAIGASATFAVYVVICCVGYLGVYLIYPETMGLELEDVGRLLS